MEENNLNDTIQGILAEAANRIHEALGENMGTNSEATRSDTKFYAKTVDWDEIMFDADAERSGAVVVLHGSEWMYKYPTDKYGTEPKHWESWDGEAASVSEFAEMCRAAHANGSTPTLIHEGY